MTSKHINRNPALGTSYKLDIPGFETLNYTVQSTEIPSVSSGGVETAYQNWGTNVPSNRVEFDPLNINFIVSEDFENYRSLYEWMIQITMTEPVVPEMMKNIVLHITNSSRNHKMQIRFHKAYPTMLSSIPFDSGVNDTTPLICSATFRYQYFEIIRDASGRTPS